jgi:hypothetical protein
VHSKTGEVSVGMSGNYFLEEKINPHVDFVSRFSRISGKYKFNLAFGWIVCFYCFNFFYCSAKGSDSHCFCKSCRKRLNILLSASSPFPLCHCNVEKI